MEEKFLLALERVRKYNQEQLLSCYDKLDESTKEALLDDILNLNFDQVEELYGLVDKEKNYETSKIEPIPFVEKDKLTNDQKEYYSKIGTEVIKKGEYAVITMAGGQRNKTRTYTDQKEHITWEIQLIRVFLRF